VNIGASLRIWLNDLCGDRSIVSARWRQLAFLIQSFLHGTPVTNTQATLRQDTRRNSSHRTLLMLVCWLTNSLEIHRQRAIDEHSNIHHRFKPCTFGVDLLGTGSGNMATDIKIKRFTILVTERWARSWSRCTGSQPASDYKSSNSPGGRLLLLSSRPALTFQAAEHHRPLAGTKLYCLVTEAHRCEQLAQGCYAAFAPSRIDRKSNALPVAPPRSRHLGVGFRPGTCCRGRRFVAMSVILLYLCSPSI